MDTTADTSSADAQATAAAIATDVADLVQRRLGDARVHLITSGPGLGRNACLQRALGDRFPDEHVVLDLTGLDWPIGSAVPVEQLERARVILVDGNMDVARDTIVPLTELVTRRRIDAVPLKYQGPRDVVLRDDVVFVFSVSRVDHRQIRRISDWLRCTAANADLSLATNHHE